MASAIVRPQTCTAAAASAFEYMSMHVILYLFVDHVPTVSASPSIVLCAVIALYCVALYCSYERCLGDKMPV